MSLIAIGLMGAFYVLVFSQFGGRLAAKNSLIWWFVGVFLMVAAVDPKFFQPLAELLGIQLVSNFVMASMIIFLLAQMIEQSSANTINSRRFRHLVSSFAVENFLSKRAHGSSDKKLKVMVVIPCYNEEEALPGIIPQLRSLPVSSEFQFDFCVVNDGSVDRSGRLLADLAPLNHTSHQINVGVAGVLLTGFRIVDRLDYDYAVQCDSDGQHPINAIPALVEHAHKHGLDLLIGSRFVSAEQLNGRSALESTSALRRLGSMMLIAALKIFGQKANVTDPTSGFRVYSKKVCRQLVGLMPDEYPEPESIALIALKGGKIAETHVHMKPRSTGVSSLSGFKSMQYMIKVITALLGLRLRSLLLRL